jgi:hypothetical protein
MKYVALTLGNLSVAEKLAQGNAIRNGMTDNPSFTTPNPTLATFDTAIANLAAKQAARDQIIEAAKAATLDLHAAEHAYDLCVTQIATYAEGVVLGDQQKLESAGFTVRKTPEPIVSLEMVTDLKVTSNSYNGVLFAKWKPVRGARTYEIQLCPDPVTQTGWRSIKPSTSSRAEIDGLTPGARIWVQVRAVAKKLVGPWSQPASKIVP